MQKENFIEKGKCFFFQKVLREIEKFQNLNKKNLKGL